MIAAHGAKTLRSMTGNPADNRNLIMSDSRVAIVVTIIGLALFCFGFSSGGYRTLEAIGQLDK